MVSKVNKVSNSTTELGMIFANYSYILLEMFLQAVPLQTTSVVALLSWQKDLTTYIETLHYFLYRKIYRGLGDKNDSLPRKRIPKD